MNIDKLDLYFVDRQNLFFKEIKTLTKVGSGVGQGPGSQMRFLATFTPAWVLGDEPVAIIMDNAATHRAAGAKLADGDGRLQSPPSSLCRRRARRSSI